MRGQLLPPFNRKFGGVVDSLSWVIGVSIHFPIAGLALGFFSVQRAEASPLHVQTHSEYYLMQTSGIVDGIQTSVGNLALGLNIALTRRMGALTEYLNVPATDGEGGTLDHRFTFGGEYAFYGLTRERSILQPRVSVRIFPTQRFTVIAGISYGKFLIRRLDNLPLFEASTDYLMPIVGLSWYRSVVSWLNVVAAVRSGYAIGVRSPFSFSALYASGSIGVSVPL